MRHLISDLGIERIAVMYQDDSYGRAGLSGVQQVLAKRRMAPVAIGSYVRNTTAVKTALLDVREGNPGAVILIGAYKSVAALIHWARILRFDPVFFTISFVGSNALARELGPDGAGVYVSQVVPFPRGSEPVVARYRRALSARSSGAAPGFVSLEGYLAGRLAILGLERSGRDLDREGFRQSLLAPVRSGLDGFRLRYGEGDNQGSDSVFLTVIGPEGRYRPITALSRSLAP